MDGNIFNLEQIKRASELGIGTVSPANIRVVPVNDESVEETEKIELILKS